MSCHDGRQGVASADIVNGYAPVNLRRRIGLPRFRQDVRNGEAGLVVKRERRQHSLVGVQGAGVIAVSTKSTRLVPGLA
jgi:hypothetical protein